ncbi:MAG: endonuclease MutS2, partial [Firmicutes bacterium]|nr:endonuclease MutS2 [Bacillota bacterium]
MAAPLLRVHDVLTWLDQELAIVRYGLATQSVIPEIGQSDLVLVNARHPLIVQPVPMALQVTEKRHVLIISGPNTGGKTVALKTTGLVVAMALSGMMVPCDIGTKIPLFHHIWADIGDEQSVEQNLSTFSSHMTRLIPMARYADPSTLCLIDEIGAGTDPEEGAALATALIDRFRQRGAYVVVTTHYSSLKILAFEEPDIENAHVEFDRDTLSPTYRLIMGQPGSSQAFYIAQRLGLDEEIGRHAQDLMSPEGRALTQVIAQVNEIRQRLDQKSRQIAQDAEQLEIRQRRLEQAEEKLKRQRERDREEAQISFRRQMNEIRQEMENAIDAVRQAQGKEQARAIENLRQAFRSYTDAPPDLARQSTPNEPPQLAVGDEVIVKGFEGVGRVAEISGLTALIEIGALRIKLALADLQKAPESVPRMRSGIARAMKVLDDQSTARQVRQKRMHMSVECDLRGQTAD